MLTCRIIPCLDIKDGRVVKGVSFENLRDAGDPIENARFYAKEGADELCFLDITASVDRRAIVAELVRRVAEEIFIPFTVGGGIRSVDDVDAILHSGADKVSLNTAAFENPAVLTESARRFGSQCIVCAIDARRRMVDGVLDFEVYLHGGRTPTGVSALKWARQAEEAGAGEILLTSMDQDGRKTGYDLELTRQVRSLVRVPVIASGGVGTKEHLLAAYREAGADALLAASIFHFREYRIGAVKEYLAGQGVPVRMPSEEIT